MVLLFISIFSTCLFHVMASPQLKLGQSGYELISINDQNADDLIPLASKITLESASRLSGIDALNLEKVNDPIDENDRFSAVLQQHKRHYDSNRYSSDPKSISESQSNMIGMTNKRSLKKNPNIYLALGIPKTFTHPKKIAKETQAEIPIFEKKIKNSQPIASYDDSDSSEEFQSPQKVNEKSVQVKIGDKKSKPVAKLSKTIEVMTEKSGNQKNEILSSAMIESDFESVNSKDSDNITNRMTDFQSVWDLIDAKSNFQKKKNKIEPPTIKSGFTMVTHFPSLRINHQKNFHVSQKSPIMFSPIYSSGFEIIAGNPPEESAVSFKEGQGKYRRIDQKNPKSSKGFGKSFQEKNLEQIPSVFVLKKINHDHLNAKISSNLPFPIIGANYNVQTFLNQQPIQPMKKIISHLETNSIPLATNNFDPSFLAGESAIFNPQSRWQKIVPRYPIDLVKERQDKNDSDLEYVDSNHVISNSVLKTDFLKNYNGKRSFLNDKNSLHVEIANEILPLNVESSKTFVNGIDHKIAPDDLEETAIDVKKEDAKEEHHEIRDVSESHSSAYSKSSCNHTKPSTPAFYQFIAKFSNTVLSKALEYESNTQAQDSISKLVEAITNKK